MVIGGRNSSTSLVNLGSRRGQAQLRSRSIRWSRALPVKVGHLLAVDQHVEHEQRPVRAVSMGESIYCLVQYT